MLPCEMGHKYIPAPLPAPWFDMLTSLGPEEVRATVAGALRYDGRGAHRAFSQIPAQGTLISQLAAADFSKLPPPTHGQRDLRLSGAIRR